MKSVMEESDLDHPSPFHGLRVVDHLLNQLNLTRDQIPIEISEEENKVYKPYIDSIEKLQRGFGVANSITGDFEGFILFSYRFIDVSDMTLELYIQYVLVQEGSRGLGTQLVAAAYKQTEYDFPGFTFVAFTEAVPTSESAVKFWLEKQAYHKQPKSFFEKTYCPCYKIYPRNPSLRANDDLALADLLLPYNVYTRKVKKSQKVSASQLSYPADPVNKVEESSSSATKSLKAN
jgi:hypothetical protein